MHKILVVDDMTSIILAIGHILMDDYDVVVATSGQEALLSAEQELPDLILLDIQMPEMDGYAVIQALRRRPATAAIPVIMISADATEATKNDVLRAGALAFITKPCDRDELLARVAAALKGTPQPMRFEASADMPGPDG